MPGKPAAKPRYAYWMLWALHVMLLASAMFALQGCGWIQQQVAGEGFQPWSRDMGKEVRSDKKMGTSSGFFWDRKAKEIEESLGGGF